MENTIQMLEDEALDHVSGGAWTTPLAGNDNRSGGHDQAPAGYKLVEVRDNGRIEKKYVKIENTGSGSGTRN